MVQSNEPPLPNKYNGEKILQHNIGRGETLISRKYIKDSIEKSANDWIISNLAQMTERDVTSLILLSIYILTKNIDLK